MEEHLKTQIEKALSGEGLAIVRIIAQVKDLFLTNLTILFW